MAPAGDRDALGVHPGKRADILHRREHVARPLRPAQANAAADPRQRVRAIDAARQQAVDDHGADARRLRRLRVLAHDRLHLAIGIDLPAAAVELDHDREGAVAVRDMGFDVLREQRSKGGRVALRQPPAANVARDISRRDGRDANDNQKQR